MRYERSVSAIAGRALSTRATSVARLGSSGVSSRNPSPSATASGVPSR